MKAIRDQYLGDRTISKSKQMLWTSQQSHLNTQFIVFCNEVQYKGKEVTIVLATSQDQSSTPSALRLWPQLCPLLSLSICVHCPPCYSLLYPEHPKSYPWSIDGVSMFSLEASQWTEEPEVTLEELQCLSLPLAWGGHVPGVGDQLQLQEPWKCYKWQLS